MLTHNIAARNTSSNLTPAAQSANPETVGLASRNQMAHPEAPTPEADIGEYLGNMTIKDMTKKQINAYMKQVDQETLAEHLNSIIQHKAAVLNQIDALETLNESGNFNKGTTQGSLTQAEAEVVGILKICGPVPLTLLQNVFIDQDLKKARKALVDKGLLAEAQVGNSKVLSLTEEDKAAA